MVLLHSNINKADKQAVEPVLAQFDELEKRIASRFARLEAKQAVLAYIKGLISPVERKNSWQLAEAIGDRDPYRFQHLLNRAAWDADALRDDLRDYVVEHLGDDNAVLIVDETGFLKKGDKSVGVQRPDCLTQISAGIVKRMHLKLQTISLAFILSLRRFDWIGITMG